jgi:hypothetical protein
MTRIAAAAQLCDVVTPIAPRGATQIHLRLGRTSDGAPKIEAIGAASDAPTWARELGLATEEYVALAHGALMELANPETREVVIRGGAAPHVVLLAEDGREVADLAVPAAAAARFVFAPPLLEALRAAGPELRARHDALGKELLGHDDWSWDPARAVLSLSRGALPWRRWAARPIATFDTREGTFAWSEPPEPICRELAAEPGHAALDTPWFPCDEALAVRLAAWVAWRMGARGMYPGAREGRIEFLAVVDSAPPGP